jgi:hypothetical protein
MELNDKVGLANVLKRLARTGELDVSSSRAEGLIPGAGENIRTVYMKGDVITIYLSESISIKRIN